MKEKLLLFFKGMIIGTAMVIPGVSGGTLAISLGLYEKIINTISHFFKNFKENVLFCFNLGLGVIVSLIICSLVLNYTFEHAPIPTILFFIGLIIGSIPMLLKKVTYKKTINFKNIIYALLGGSIILSLTFLKSGNEVALKSFDIAQSVKLIGVGFVAAATLVIPGISGSFMLMVLGYYQPLLTIITETIKFNNLCTNLLVLIPFGIGLAIGVIVIAKIIEYLLKKHQTKTYYAIIGFLLASIIEVFISLFSYRTNISQIIIGIILFVIAACLSVKVLKND